MASIACSAKLMSLLIHRLGFFFCSELFFPKEKSLVRWRLGLVARVGWLGANFLLRTFLFEKKSGKALLLTQAVRKGLCPTLRSGKVKVTQTALVAIAVHVVVSADGNLLPVENGTKTLCENSVSPLRLREFVDVFEHLLVSIDSSALWVLHCLAFSNGAVIVDVVSLSTFGQTGHGKAFGFSEFGGLEGEKLVSTVSVGNNVDDGDSDASDHLGAGLEPARGKRIGNGWIHFREVLPRAAKVASNRMVASAQNARLLRKTIWFPTFQARF